MARFRRIRNFVHTFFYAVTLLAIAPKLFAQCGEWRSFSANGVQGLGEGNLINAMIVFQNDLIVAGHIPTIGSTSINNITRWNGSSWQSIGGGMSGGVWALAVYNGELVAGGAFLTAGGSTVNNIARWNGNSWQPLENGLNGPVNNLVVFNGELYATGTFQIGNSNRIARWNGSIWQSLGTGSGLPPLGVPPLGGLAHTYLPMTVHNNELVVTGDFSHANGMVMNAIARWNGSVWQPFVAGSQIGGVTGNAITSSGGQLFVGGSGVKRWTGFLWEQVGDLPGIPVVSLGTYNGNLVAGRFKHVSLPPTSNTITFWNGAAWISMGPEIQNPGHCSVNAFREFEGMLVAGGQFATIGSGLFNEIAAWIDCPKGLPCPADITGDGTVGVPDLLAVISEWGQCQQCPADIAPSGGDGQVGVPDLLRVIGSWGLCP